MKQVNFFVTSVIVVFNVVLFSSCEKSKQQVVPSTVIKIGVFEPMTGANAAGGAMEVEGIKIANKLFPEVLGKKIELVIMDNKSDKVEAANAAERLVNKEKVVAIIGSWGSSFCIAAGPIIKDKVPAVSASATNPLVTKGNGWYFRVCFIDPFQGKVMANYAYHQLKARKAGIIQEISNDYSVGLARFFVDAFKQLTHDSNAIVGRIANYNTGDNDFTAQVTSIANLKPDVIFAPGNYSESALLIKQARDQGIKIPFIGGDTWETPEFVDIGKQAVEGSVFSTFFTSEIPITKMSEQFLAAYREQYQKEPAAVTALGFDAYLVIHAAIQRAQSADPQKIRDEIAKTKDFEGAAGIITLNETGDAVKNAVIKTVKDGKFTYLTTVNP